MQSKPNLRFRERSDPHENFVTDLNARLKRLGYTVLTDTYHEIWDRKNYSQFWNRFDTMSWFIRYKPDILALHKDHSLWLEAKTSGKSQEIYFPFSGFFYTAVLAYWFELPIVWTYRDHNGWERAWKTFHHWELVSPNLTIYVGTNLKESQWKSEYEWILSLISRAGFRIIPDIQHIDVRGSGKPFIALPKDRIKSLRELNDFLEDPR